MNDLDPAAVEGLGQERKGARRECCAPRRTSNALRRLFFCLPWKTLPMNAAGADVDCIGGRWAPVVAPRVCHLHCIDASPARNVTRKNLNAYSRSTALLWTQFRCQTTLPILVTLSASPHTGDQKGIVECIHKLKPSVPSAVFVLRF